MSIFSKSNKKKIVLALACASILGDRTQAIKEPQSLQTVASVGGATSRNNNLVQQGLSKKRKLAIVAAVASLAAVTIIGGIILGVTRNKNEDSNPGNGEHSNEIFTKAEVQKILEDLENKPKSEIKDDEDLKENLMCVTEKLSNNQSSKKICKRWCLEIFKKFQKSAESFKHDKEKNKYTIVDENSPSFQEISKLMTENNLPNIFSAAKSLGKEIVPVFQVTKKENSNKDKIYLYFAVKDEIEDYLSWQFNIYCSYCSDLDEEA